MRPLAESGTGQLPYEITDSGRAELAMWFATPLNHSDRPRDELAIKVALALSTPGVDVSVVVQAQRAATIRKMREYTRLKYGTDRPADLAWKLGIGVGGRADDFLVESSGFAADADTGRANVADYYADATQFVDIVVNAVRTTPAEITQAVKEFEALGAEELIFNPTSDDLDEISRLADLVH